jgi:hypothetical protein
VPAGGDGTLGCQTYLVEHTIGNLDGDSDVDFADLAKLGNYWLEGNCGGCGGADFTCDKKVDLYDLQDFANNWLTDTK